MNGLHAIKATHRSGIVFLKDAPTTHAARELLGLPEFHLARDEAAQKREQTFTGIFRCDCRVCPGHFFLAPRRTNAWEQRAYPSRCDGCRAGNHPQP